MTDQPYGPCDDDGAGNGDDARYDEPTTPDVAYADFGGPVLPDAA